MHFSPLQAAPAPVKPHAEPAVAAVKDPFAREVTINGANANVRVHLLRRTALDELQTRTNTIITVKGRYYTPNAPQDPNEPPLYLLVKPGAGAGESDEGKLQAVEAAANEIQHMVQIGEVIRPGAQTGFASTSGYGRPPGLAPAVPAASYQQQQQQQLPAIMYPSGGAAPSTAGYGAPSAPLYAPVGYHPLAHHAMPVAPPPTPPAPNPVMIFVGISQPSPELLEKIRGPGGAYLTHINIASGGSVILRGQGSLTMEG